ncbi:hypothetical protein L873DRAFT_1477087 [Choiromyces venosus 120613-1]|uniref:Uncharacterized protein n=1 Tax=Choiromyces venosus 120613-1 TaxID=1336337 RepID=A0A3N4J7M6_9PEZI|nr:hypothetical protein L873DRAFT_1477087 [Choiromyces venosus 120613-1]
MSSDIGRGVALSWLKFFMLLGGQLILSRGNTFLKKKKKKNSFPPTYIQFYNGEFSNNRQNKK